MTTPTWITAAGFLGTVTELVSTSTKILAQGTDTIYSVISGHLPLGLSLSNTGTIAGTPSEVIKTTRSKFVVRARNSGTVADRTFYMDTEGPTNPIWSTGPGYLPIGYGGQGYALNYQYVNYSVAASAQTLPPGYKLRYFLEEGEKLPPGLLLSEDGVISGYVKDKFVTTDLNFVGLPKVYTFNITATDGASTSTSGAFKIMVINGDILRSDTNLFGFTTTNLVYLGTGTSTSIINTVTSISHLQTPQFLHGSNLGEIRANNNEYIPVTVYDAAPFKGPLTYSLQTGRPETATTSTVYHTVWELQPWSANTSMNTWTSIILALTSTYVTYVEDPDWVLPEGMSLDTETGYIYGFVPYQPAYSRTYNFTVNATKQDVTSGEITTGTNVFSLTVKGETDSGIEWITDGNLGSIDTGIISELAVKAGGSAHTLNYKLTGGQLPPGLTVAQDGSIYGRVNYGATGVYTATIAASDSHELSAVYRDFTITATETTATEYTEIYVRPFFTPERRASYQEFISNPYTFDSRLIYRYYDPNFGVQPTVKMILEFGIEKIDLAHYVPALRESFYRRRFNFGDVKKAIARNSAGDVVYEIVYVDAVDNLAGSSHVVYDDENIYYPGSVDNMRKQLSLIPLEDGTYIEIDEYHKPRFMRTPQAGDYRPPEYMRVIPLCYALPGQGDRIISRIKLSGFDFKMLDFEIDRIIVQQSTDYATAKYLILERQSIGDPIKTDNQLFGMDWAENPEGTVRLDDESGYPINRNFDALYPDPYFAEILLETNRFLTDENDIPLQEGL